MGRGGGVYVVPWWCSDLRVCRVIRALGRVGETILRGLEVDDAAAGYDKVESRLSIEYVE